MFIASAEIFAGFDTVSNQQRSLTVAPDIVPVRKTCSSSARTRAQRCAMLFQFHQCFESAMRKLSLKDPALFLFIYFALSHCLSSLSI